VAALTENGSRNCSISTFRSRIDVHGKRRRNDRGLQAEGKDHGACCPVDGFGARVGAAGGRTGRHGAAPGRVIHDLSREGFKASVTGTVSVGDEISVGSSSIGVLRGEVMWVEKAMFGARFAMPISSARVDQAAVIETVVSLPFGGAAMTPAPALAAGGLPNEAAIRFKLMNKVTALGAAAVLAWAGTGLLCGAAFWFVHHGL
jgi:hypothetical protein